MQSKKTIKTLLLAIVFAAHTNSMPFAAADDSGDKDKKDKPEFLKEETVETDHVVTIRGQKIPYRATTGTLVLKEEAGEEQATIFFIAYTLSAKMDAAKRPITFTFNGGPGSSSVWLHLGALGPRRVDLGNATTPIPPPYQLIENEFSILDDTDLVFIDPVSTGFSRPSSNKKAREFHGVNEDIRSVATFIRLYTTRNSRWGSPKFLAGESYGTIRAAGLAHHLQEEFGMYINGVILISTVLDFQTIRFDDNNDLPFVLFLPAYAATARYHQSSTTPSSDLGSFLKTVERFAVDEYAVALLQGAAVDAQRRQRAVAALAEYTGLPPAYVEENELRVPIFRFAKELLRAQRRIIGRFDSRVTGIDNDPAGEGYEFDPSYSAFFGTAASTLNDYVRGELGFKSDLPYEILTSRVQPWDYGAFENRYVNLAQSLRAAMTRNPFLRVFVASGYYDLATPYFATDYTFNHLGLDKSLRSNIQMAYYEAGHMMYFHRPSLVKMKEDLTTFLRDAQP